eukprot:961505-Pelagomonas_calceolata.AAC.3
MLMLPRRFCEYPKGLPLPGENLPEVNLAKKIPRRTRSRAQSKGLILVKSNKQQLSDYSVHKEQARTLPARSGLIGWPAPQASSSAVRPPRGRPWTGCAMWLPWTR